MMTRILKLLYYVGAVALLAGIASRMFLPEIYSYIYLSGAVLFALTQFFLRVKHSNFVVHRLVVQQQIAGLLLVASGVLMFTHSSNEWLAIMLCGAFIELYTAFRIPAELEKQK